MWSLDGHVCCWSMINNTTGNSPYLTPSHTCAVTTFRKTLRSSTLGPRTASFPLLVNPISTFHRGFLQRAVVGRVSMDSPLTYIGCKTVVTTPHPLSLGASSPKQEMITPTVLPQLVQCPEEGTGILTAIGLVPTVSVLTTCPWS